MEQENELIITGGTMGKDKVLVKEIPVNKIKIARNSRLDISDDEIEGLMQSIKQTGLLQPIGVIAKGQGFEVIYGNRRFLATSKLGKTKIPCIVHSHKTNVEDDLKNLTENIQRRNISLMEAGRYMMLLRDQGLTPGEIAVRLGVTGNYVRTCVDAYQNVPKKFRADVEINTTKTTKRTPGKVTVRAATAIISAGKKQGIDSKVQEQLFELAKNENFSPENVLNYASAIKAGKKNPLTEAAGTRRVCLHFWIETSDYDRLYKKTRD